jgi:LysR family transcriptional activator of nhaA
VDRLNYHHLFYFWAVARAGSLARASAELRVGQPTLSTQLKLLEGELGQQLFERHGRRLALTDAGRLALRYAEDIFRTGRELQQALRGGPGGHVRLQVGVVQVMPKLMAQQLLQPALSAVEGMQLDCREGTQEELLQALSLHELDLVLTDGPVPEGSRARTHSHLLGQSGVSFFAAGKRVEGLRRAFPRGLDGAPLLVPAEGSWLRRELDAWLQRHGLRPDVRGEFEDSALLKAFGAAGAGVFTAPTVIAEEVCRMYGVRRVGEADDLRERFYAVTVERRLRHPAVAALVESARERLFGKDSEKAKSSL